MKPFFPLELGRERLFVTFAIKALVAAAPEMRGELLPCRNARLLTGNVKESMTKRREKKSYCRGRRRKRAQTESA